MTTAHPSNYTKGRTQKIEFLVLHYTAGRNDSAAGNLRYFESPRGASAHYFVDRKGWLQSVDDGDTAWSVGTAGVYQQKHPRCRNGNSRCAAGIRTAYTRWSLQSCGTRRC